jgi:hypothetical protein
MGDGSEQSAMDCGQPAAALLPQPAVESGLDSPAGWRRESGSGLHAVHSGLARPAVVADGWHVTEESPPRRDRRVALLLWLLPLWLVVSSLGGLWLYLRKQAAAEDDEQVRFTTGISEAGLRDDVGKFLGFVGERHSASSEGVQGLKRAAAMIEGSLGPGNAGYLVERVAGPSLPGGRWPLLVAELKGKEDDLPPLWVVAGYDARPGSPGAEANATGVASVLAAAHAMASELPRRPVRFAFLPHAYETEGPLLEAFGILKQQVGNASSLLVVESTGAGKSLLISSRDAENPALAKAGGLGEVVGAEAICLEDDFDLSSALFETGLPAVRVATRPVVKVDEADAAAPDPAVHAAATSALVYLIQRLSES